MNLVIRTVWSYVIINVLYIIKYDNKINIFSQACLDHTWYLAVDMQLFLISPFILYPLAKKPRVGISIFIIFFIGSIITPMIIAVQHKYSGGLFNINRYCAVITLKFGYNLRNKIRTLFPRPFSISSLAIIFEVLKNYYVRTYVRATPWLMGIIFGYKLNSTINTPSTVFHMSF